MTPSRDQHNASPLYQIKADLFKGLSHPIRIRILELIHASPTSEVSVAEILRNIDCGPAQLSQHLAVLKRHQIVASSRRGKHVYYRFTLDEVAQLLISARSFLLASLDFNSSQLAAVSDLPPVARS